MRRAQIGAGTAPSSVRFCKNEGNPTRNRENEARQDYASRRARCQFCKNEANANFLGAVEREVSRSCLERFPVALTLFVIAGLDPAIHLLAKKDGPPELVFTQVRYF